MQAKRVMAAAWASVSCVLCAASCIQGPETSGAGGDADGEPAVVETKDDGDLDLGSGSEPPEAAADPRLLALCLDLARASVPAKEAFCRSLPDSGSRARCWQHRWNRAEWMGWCYAEFS